MKISYKHILNSLIENPSIEEISDKLFQLGHEHEIERNIFNMEFTPNRGDCLSILGLSRDLNIFYKKNTKFIDLYDGQIDELQINFTNNVPHDCPQISFLNIQIEGEVQDYKGYLNDYFDDLSIGKKNFFTDISNYLSYEMGQPTHCYDYDLLGNNINLEVNSKSYDFETLLGEKISLSPGDLVFTSNNEIINLAGVMGGKATACSDDTSNALIECAFFNPEKIIGKSLKYNIQSDAAYKFERGTDINCHENILRRFIKIVSDHAKITKLELYRFNNIITPQKKIDFDVKKINSILGVNISSKEYHNYLIKLGFDIDNVIKVPSYRTDVKSQNDLAEEIARLIGYDKIDIDDFKLDQSNNLHEIASKEKSIKNFLIKHGFAEVINSPFTRVQSNDPIKVDNPLDKNRSCIRTNLIDSLVGNVVFNENRQNDSIKFFEISDVYYNVENQISRSKKLGVIVSGRRGHNYVDFAKKLDKEYLVEVFKNKYENIENLIMNIDRSNINSKIKTPIYAFEIPLNELSDFRKEPLRELREINDYIKYKPISEFPSSFRDLSISISNNDVISDVLFELNAFSSPILKDSYLFDFFNNKKNNEIKVGYRFVFQSRDKTLTDKEIDREIENIANKIHSINSVNIPGYF